MNHNEQDTCRICSGPAEADQPLFYPCKCSGTIRYIHQECLKTWLEHSKKSTCDVCKHPYAFTKVYAPDMPERVPITVLVYKLVEGVVSGIAFMLRTILATFVWLTVLPYATVVAWRFYFRFGNLVAWLISLHIIRSPPTPPQPAVPSRDDLSPEDYLKETVILPYLRSIPGDIFTGQMIASLIVIAFLAVFLLREWIMQNARPGVFEDVAVQDVPVQNVPVHDVAVQVDPPPDPQFRAQQVQHPPQPRGQAQAQLQVHPQPQQQQQPRPRLPPLHLHPRPPPAQAQQPPGRPQQPPPPLPPQQPQPKPQQPVPRQPPLPRQQSEPQRVQQPQTPQQGSSSTRPPPPPRSHTRPGVIPVQAQPPPQHSQTPSGPRPKSDLEPSQAQPPNPGNTNNTIAAQNGGGRPTPQPSSSTLRVVNADPSSSTQPVKRDVVQGAAGVLAKPSDAMVKAKAPNQKYIFRAERSEKTGKRAVGPIFTVRRRDGVSGLDPAEKNKTNEPDLGGKSGDGEGGKSQHGDGGENNGPRASVATTSATTTTTPASAPVAAPVPTAASAAVAEGSSSRFPKGSFTFKVPPDQAGGDGVPLDISEQNIIFTSKRKAQEDADYQRCKGRQTGDIPEERIFRFNVFSPHLPPLRPRPQVLNKYENKYETSLEGEREGQDGVGSLDVQDRPIRSLPEGHKFYVPPIPPPPHPRHPRSLTFSEGYQFTFESPRDSPSTPNVEASPSNGPKIFTYPQANGKSPELPAETRLNQVAQAVPAPALEARVSLPVSNGTDGLDKGKEVKGKEVKKPVESEHDVTPQLSAASNLSSSSQGVNKVIAQPDQNGKDETTSVLPRRPPLAASVIPIPDQGNAEASTSAKPLPSPGLATYKPPEELIRGDKEYFESGLASQIEERDENEADDEDEDDEEGRFTDYFVEPKAPVQGEAPAIRDSDDEDGGEARRPERRQERPANEGQENRPAPGQPPAEQEADDEERQQNLEEDLDGAMEAVGLRGPVVVVFQNASLMFFILNMMICAGIWLPFTIGKTSALLTLEPRRTLYLLHLPIRAVRLLTDPTVDALIFCMRYLALFIAKRCSSFLPAFGILEALNAPVPVSKSSGWFPAVSELISTDRIISFFKTTQTPSAALSPPIKSAGSMFSLVRNSLQWPFSGISSSQPPREVAEIVASPWSPWITNSPAFQFLEDLFADVGKYVRGAVMAAFQQWTAMVENDGSAERVLAVFLGYIIVAFHAALYLNTFTVGNMRTAGRAIRSAIRQQMIVTKVALFIVIELIMFPFGCGVMLDYCTLPLFPEVSIGSRLAFFARAPVTACFYHWLLGTMFMYQFAILLATYRSILRPGCIWFIKDPQDPSFHPIRDILDRSTIGQLSKLGMSAIMYAIVIFMGVGMVISGLDSLLPFVLPLRWKLREPLSEIPVDLLFVHLVLPPTLHYFRPKKMIRNLMTVWSKWFARQLRLSSYMFGERYEDEEYTISKQPLSYIRSRLSRPTTPVAFVKDGQFCRVPAGDNIAFLRDRPAMIRVDERGEAHTQRGREIIQQQDAEARRMGRNPAEDYKVVYLPPDFIKRILLFISWFWLSAALGLFIATGLPIIAGRAVFGLFTTHEMHDGYSFIIGFYFVWWSWLVGCLFVKVRIRRERHASAREGSGDGVRVPASWLLFLFKRITVYSSKIIWLVFWLGFVIPTLLSIVVDLYMIIPLRTLSNPGFVPTIHLFESWASGLILAKLVVRVHTRLGADFGGPLEAIRQNGWRRPEPWQATKDFIIPVVTGLVGMIGFPPLCVYASSKYFDLGLRVEDMNRLVYPMIFVVVAGFHFAAGLAVLFTKWTQNIRDKEFLVELRLRNLEQTPRNGEAKPETPAQASK